MNCISHPEDIEYVKREFYTIVELLDRAIQDGSWPRPAYVLPGGVAYFPADYLSQEKDRERFLQRFRDAAKSLGLPDDVAQSVEIWDEFLAGTFGVCLHTVTPENVAKKIALVAEIEALTSEPQPTDTTWLKSLRSAVDALDALERPFSPVFDRVAFPDPPTRDRLIRDVRQRFLDATNPDSRD